jgi:hypothetical protein
VAGPGGTGVVFDVGCIVHRRPLHRFFVFRQLAWEVPCRIADGQIGVWPLERRQMIASVGYYGRNMSAKGTCRHRQYFRL